MFEQSTLQVDNDKFKEFWPNFEGDPRRIADQPAVRSRSASRHQKRRSNAFWITRPFRVFLLAAAGGSLFHNISFIYLRKGVVKTIQRLACLTRRRFFITFQYIFFFFISLFSICSRCLNDRAMKRLKWYPRGMRPMKYILIGRD